MQLGITWRKLDGWLLAAVGLLLSISTVILFSLHQFATTESQRFEKQLVFIGLSLIVCLVFSQISYRQCLQYSFIIYLSGAIALLAVLLLGTTVNGTTGWFQFAGISLQPVEFAKLAFIITAARFLADRSFEMEHWKTIWHYGLLLLGYSVLVLAQPDLGSAVILVGIATVLGLTTAIRPRQLLLLAGSALVLAVIAWFFILNTYQQNRLLTFIDPQRDPLQSGYHVTQSIISVGSGEWFGRGLGRGPQSQLQFLPERETDFIFAVISEELGFVAAAVVIASFTFIIWRLWRLSRLLRDDAARYLVVGYCALIFGQVFINIGMNIGMMPVTGIPLPFVSAGGSSLLALAIGLGMVMNALSEHRH